MLIIFSGLPGVGKTTVARIVAEQTKAAYLRIDTIEQTLRAATGSSGPIGPEGYLIAYRVAADNLALGHSVVADCVNAFEVSRAAWRNVAQEHAQSTLFVHLVCSDLKQHRRRVEERTADLPSHVLPSWSAVNALPFAPLPPDALVVDTSQLSASEAAAEVIRRIA
jgi:predicted kinase